MRGRSTLAQRRDSVVAIGILVMLFVLLWTPARAKESQAYVFAATLRLGWSEVFLAEVGAPAEPLVAGEAVAVAAALTIADSLWETPPLLDPQTASQNTARVPRLAMGSGYDVEEKIYEVNNWQFAVTGKLAAEIQDGRVVRPRPTCSSGYARIGYLLGRAYAEAYVGQGNAHTLNEARGLMRVTGRNCAFLTYEQWAAAGIPMDGGYPATGLPYTAYPPIFANLLAMIAANEGTGAVPPPTVVVPVPATAGFPPAPVEVTDARQVPNVAGLPWREAQSVLYNRDLGSRVEQGPVASSAAAVGTVMNQTPAPGEWVPANTVVELVVFTAAAAPVTGRWAGGGWGEIVLSGGNGSYTGTYSGTYDTSRLGQITLSYDGQRWSGTWGEPAIGRGGDLYDITVSDDGRTISGRYGTTSTGGERELAGENFTWRALN